MVEKKKGSDGDKGRDRRGREKRGTVVGGKGRGRVETAVDALLPANAGLLCIIKAMCKPRPFMQAAVHEICIQRHACTCTSIGATPIHATRHQELSRICEIRYWAGYLDANLLVPINFT